MKKVSFLLFVIILPLFVLNSCSSTRSMETPNNHIQFVKDDFEFSKQLSAEASVTKVFGVDWERLFGGNTGSIGTGENIQTRDIDVSQVPVVGSFIGKISMGTKGAAKNYALYNLMQQHPDYDVVFYPTFHIQKSGIPGFNKTTAIVKARLARIKE